jgi:hypothetical protein
VDLRLGYQLAHANGATCARNPIRARVVGPGVGGVVSTDFYLDGHALGTDGAAPFERRLDDVHGRASVGIRVSMLDGRRLTVTREVRACP